MSRTKAIDVQVRKEIAEYLSDDTDTIPRDLTLDEIPDIALATRYAAFHYNPVNPIIMNAPHNAVNFDDFLKLIEINPEYLCSKFGQGIIRAYRVFLYHPNKDIADHAKDTLESISRKIVAKKRSHYPEKFVQSHHYCVKFALEKIWNDIKNMHELHKLINEEYFVDISEDHLIDRSDNPIKNPKYWATYVIEKQFGLTHDTAKKYTKKTNYDIDELNELDSRMKELIKPLE